MEATYVDIGGDEFANNQRTITYMRNGIRPQGVRVVGDCGCPNIRELLACDPVPTDPYSLPALDPAPWYDINEPVSADFAGLLITNVEGYDSTFTRPVNSRLGGGAALGRGRFAQRQLTFTGVLYGRTCCSVSYGLRWLTSSLAGTSCAGCTGKDLQFLECCPQTEPDCECRPDAPFCPESPPPQPIPPCGPFKIYKNSGLVSGPTVTAKRGYSHCGCGCSEIVEVQFTIATDPCGYCSDPIDLLHQEFGLGFDCRGLFVKIIPPAVCPPDPVCATTTECGKDPLCPDPADPPTYGLSTDPCECDPIGPVKNCVAIPKSLYGEFFSAVPIITVYAGSLPMRNVTFRFYENPLGKPCDELDECFACGGFRIRFIPAFSQIEVDGSSGEVTVNCPGGITAGGESNLTTLDGVPFNVPTFCCVDFCLCVEADTTSIADDSFIDVKILRRDCPC